MPKSKKVLSIQDVSCYGQCSLTVALPIISACGVETAIIPSAVLSTHTGGFTGFTFADLTEELPKISAHWQKEGINFDAIYTGYIGSKKQIGYVADIIDAFKCEKVVVDPAMADNGKLYYGFDEAFAKEMSKLCGKADVILPNLTEAAYLLGESYVASGYDKAWIHNLMRRLTALGAKAVVLTGVSFEADKLGVAVYEKATDKVEYYFSEKIPVQSHGTGDVYASAFVGALMRGKSLFEAAKIAVDYTVECIKITVPFKDEHWYGVQFEQAIPYLIKLINE